MPRASRYLGAAVLSALADAAAVAQAGLAKPTEPQVKFTASGPAGLKIEGKTSELDLAEECGNVALTVRLGKIDTGIGVRDKHTKDCLDADKFPDTKRTVARAAFKLPASGHKASGEAPATLVLHGKTLPTSV